MEKKQEHLKFGLIGKSIGYSFSRSYFRAKFKKEGIQATYDNFDCNTIDEVERALENTSINGYNVTIPYKEAVIPLLDELDREAQKINAVNTIKRLPNGRLKGYNTDYVGFRDSLIFNSKGINFELALSESKSTPKALILGTGGASKAVEYALNTMGFSCQYVSRKRTKNAISYEDLNEDILQSIWIIVNCTPLGTFPDIELSPDIPYEYLSVSHIAYDLIYNPDQTLFLKNSLDQGATTFNGLPMLEGQAEHSWQIWMD